MMHFILGAALLFQASGLRIDRRRPGTTEPESKLVTVSTLKSRNDKTIPNMPSERTLMTPRGTFFPVNSEGDWGYNPSVTELHLDQRAGLGGAHYVAVARNTKRTLSLMLMDRTFKELHRTNIGKGKDARVYTHGNRTILTWVTNSGGKNKAKVRVQELRLNLVSESLTATRVGQHADFNGKNIGLMSEDGKLTALMWLKPEAIMESTGLEYNMQKSAEQCSDELDISNFHETTGHTQGVMKNSINPVLLPGGEQYLGVMHVSKGAHEHMQYFHYVVLFDTKPPHKVTAVSEQFCIPAPGGGGCQNIQMIFSGVIGDGHNVRAAEDMVFTYGADDSRSLMLRMPLADVITFAQGGDPPSFSSLDSESFEEVRTMSGCNQNAWEHVRAVTKNVDIASSAA